ncbi:integrase family protein [Pseudonocardia dioxanivorans CB1190]|uniref:Integrase family protein n=1 Tax=Pseudonocardia dioxanivorans (strain ATCC 55486 / DSM 44775 / JCM 13855 / CB1190) TaxID=675635 RepID=F4CXH6_PSEUX|nr:tyrosine-type recombinase/integrase [Pseudonocardia dioxanivorans]AEA26550.1 integrase family protein [Pseudonocardia dioxanivorans CB1190]
MAPTGRRRRKRAKGGIEQLPSGSFRVYVYAGWDPVTKRRHYLKEVVPAGPSAAAEAERVLRRLGNQVDERRHPRTAATVDELLEKHFDRAVLERSTLDTYRGYAEKHISPLIGQVQVGALDGDVFDAFYRELRRCREHCRTKFIEHRTAKVHECDDRCRPHSCSPLGVSTIRQIHFILSGALKRAVRWRWIAVNPIGQAEPPPAPVPAPKPPTAQEAARILIAAWGDAEWGTLVWLVMVTGVRRGELCGLRWRNLDLDAGVLVLDRSIGQRGSDMWEKDTKTHQQRRIALDPETVDVMRVHRERCESRAGEFGLRLGRDAFVFSLAPDGSRHYQPNSVSQRYAKLVKRLEIHTSIHKLRHFSATELIAAGVDIRTVAGRLGHSGGGTTTLRTYAAFVSESDQRAATSLSARLPMRPADVVLPPLSGDESDAPYRRVAEAIRSAVKGDGLTDGQFLPSVKAIAARYVVSVGTAHRALDLLRGEGLLRSGGRGFQVAGTPVPAPAVGPVPEPTSAHAPQMHEVELRRKGRGVARFSTEVDPGDSQDLLDLLIDAVCRSGGEESDYLEYDIVVHLPGRPDEAVTYVPRRRRRAS